ncbi:hypothetical protein [Novipirellula maiorica]|uniref:hypothetical protein n=1 Tax=Novipirellula maiorica TaxID=1265734 RepID=UPI001F370930|nr:hypothetical protein [Rhodopirellula maiorica]
MQAALDAAAGGVLLIGEGEYLIASTLRIPPSTRVEGAGPMDVWSDVRGGTVLETFGVGTTDTWQDTGKPELDNLSPLLVFAGNNVRLSNIGLRTGADSSRWDVGVLMPSVKRCSLEHVAIHGPWKVAACLLDATWSPRNKRMVALHGGKINRLDE